MPPGRNIPTLQMNCFLNIIISNSAKKSTKNSLSTEKDKAKQKQLDVINNANPAPNTYLTWVRSVDDIKTLAETLEDSDFVNKIAFLATKVSDNAEANIKSLNNAYNASGNLYAAIGNSKFDFWG